MIGNDAPAYRLCPLCGAAEIMQAGPAWPEGWRCETCGGELARADGFPLLAPALADRTVGMDPASFAFLATVEELHFWFRQRNRLIVGLARRYFPATRSYLELGCGNGVVMAALARAYAFQRAIGSELHPSGLRIARDRLPHTVDLVQMDARRIAFRSAFDLVGAFDVLEHIAEDEAVLAEIAAALRPNGGVILAVPQHPLLWSGTDEIAHHVRRYRRGELEAKVEKAGLRVLRSTSYVSLLLPLMLASRLLDKLRGDGGQAMIAREFAISPRTNALLGGLTALEVSGTLAGLSWPVGGSRVVVAAAPA